MTFRIEGVNDGKECQKRAEVVDITLSGPARGQNALYSKYTSLFSPFSSINGIRVAIQWNFFGLKNGPNIGPKTDPKCHLKRIHV